jgi:hypothetical protein
MTLARAGQPAPVGSRGAMMAEAADIVAFYSSLVGGAPYPGLTLAVCREQPARRPQPAYFAVVHQIIPSAELVWRSDPVSFDAFPLFFLAHEVAHQWWGHAVGWKNYHEQWISEGLRAVLRGALRRAPARPGAFNSVLRQMRQTAIAASDQGPIYLGYRLGHIRGDDRVFRAWSTTRARWCCTCCAGWSAMTRSSPASGCSTIAGSSRRRAPTTSGRSWREASGRDLNRFFDTWVYGAAVPRVSFRSTVRGGRPISGSRRASPWTCRSPSRSPTRPADRGRHRSALGARHDDDGAAGRGGPGHHRQRRPRGAGEHRPLRPRAPASGGHGR